MMGGGGTSYVYYSTYKLDAVMSCGAVSCRLVGRWREEFDSSII